VAIARQRLDSAGWIFVFYQLLLVWAPLPLGSNRPWAWAVLEVWIFVLAAAWVAGRLRGNIPSSDPLRKAWPVLLCAAAWVAYIWFQLLPLPIDILRVLSPEAARWHLAAALPDVPFAAPLTLDRYATLDGACLSTAYALFLALSIALLDRRDRIQTAAFTLVLSGIIQAVYGTVIDTRRPGEAAHGTFVNRNHFAGYLVLCLSAGIGVLIGSLTGAKSASWKQFFRNVLDWMLTRRMVLRLGLLVMVIALVLSHSRMGNSAFFLSLLGVGLTGLVLSRRATRSMVILLVSLVALDLLVVGTYFGARQVIERIAQTTPQTEDRDEVAQHAIEMWKDYPAFGAGLGSYRAVIPRYTSGTGSAYTHAHNDYLEFAAETGVVGVLLLGLMVSMSFLAALRAQYVRVDPLMRGISFASMMGITALLIHATVEFSLQIPAIALTAMLFLALGWISLYRGHGGS
jgi:putative inorganic carbon (HCO3(-)) transporter